MDLNTKDIPYPKVIDLRRWLKENTEVLTASVILTDMDLYRHHHPEGVKEHAMERLVSDLSTVLLRSGMVEFRQVRSPTVGLEVGVVLHVVKPKARAALTPQERV